MKAQKNLIIAKLSLLILILLPISPSYGMMPRLRLGLQGSLKAAAAYRTTFSNALNPTFKKHASTIGRGIVKTAAFGGITVASFPPSPGDLTRKQFQFDFWPDDNNENFLDMMIMEQSPEKTVTTFSLFPKLFTNENLEQFTKHHSDYAGKIASCFPAQPPNFLKAQILEKGSRDDIIYLLLNMPHFFTKEEEQKIIAQYGDQIIEGIHASSIPYLSDRLVTLLRPLIIEKGSTDLIVDCLFGMPNFFTPEEQQKILTRNNKTTLDRWPWFDLEDFGNPPDEIKNTFRSLLINQGSEKILFNSLLLPDFLTPKEKQVIFKKITSYIVNNLEEEHVPYLCPALKDLLVQHIIKQECQSFKPIFFLDMSTLFNEAQQAEIVTKHSDGILKNLTWYQIQDLPPTVQNLLRPLIIEKGSSSLIIECITRLNDFFTHGELKTIIEQRGDSLLHTIQPNELTYLPTTAKDLLRSFIIKQGSSPALIVKCLLYLEEVFTPQEQQELIRKYDSYIIENITDISEYLSEHVKDILKTLFIKKGSPKAIAKLLLYSPHLFNKEEQVHLMALHADTIITLLEETGLYSLSQAWDVKKSAEPSLLGDLIVEKGSEKFIATIMASSHKELFSEKQRNLIIDKYNKKYKTTFTVDDSGPLFSDYLLRHPENLLFFLNSKHEYPQFFDLFPAIEKYTQKQYAQDHIVLFHGQKSIWVLLEVIYSELLQLKNNNAPSSNFKHLRFTQHSPLSETDIKNIQLYGFDYSTGLKNSPATDAILFTNLHPAANHEGSNSWHYAITNHDFSGDETSFYHDIVKKIFADLEMSAQYAAIQSQDPHFFDNLYESFNTIVKKQGNHGNLVTISMAKPLAKKLVYSTDFCGKQKSLAMETSAEKVTTFDEPIPPITSTINTVKIAENFHGVSDLNAYALILAEPIINEQAAQKEDVLIKYFNTFENTQEYRDLVTTFTEKIKAIQTGPQQYKLLATFLGFLKKRFS